MVRNRLKLLRSDRAASLLEYALLLTLIVVAGIAALQALKNSVSQQFSVVASSV